MNSLRELWNLAELESRFCLMIDRALEITTFNFCIIRHLPQNIITGNLY